MALIGAPAVGEKPPDANRLQLRFQRQERPVFSPPEDVREDGSGAMSQGLPPPARRLFFFPTGDPLASASTAST